MGHVSLDLPVLLQPQFVAQPQLSPLAPLPETPWITAEHFQSEEKEGSHGFDNCDKKSPALHEMRHA